jgi:ABC-type multidrug transport system ATPase subunit/ABC-type multidrug transport system permease subunit
VLVARDVEVTVASGIRILGPVSVEVAPGSLVALMGASGSGKSTLLRVLAGIEEPTAGEATWADTPTDHAVHALGYVPQRESVYDRLTAREALHYAASLRLDPAAAGDGRVSSVLSELDLVEQAGTLIANLSGGERRRVACGIELVGNPRALLLDEPTSGLDTVLERRLMELFRRLADHGRAVFVATHATASLDLCDQVVVLDRGRTAHRGDPDLARAHLQRQAHEAEPGQHGAPDDLSGLAPIPEAPTRPLGVEFRALAGRYYRTLTRDRRTLALLIGQAPLIGLLIGIVFGPGALGASASPLDAVELVLMLMTGAIWLGVSSACREVVKERGLVERDFDFGVRLDIYMLAKAAVLFGLTLVQVVLLTAVVLFLQPLHLAASASLELLALGVLTAWASVAMGLLASSLARSVDQAAGSLPILLMPQLLLAGALIPTAQMPTLIRALSNIVYARWAYAGLGSAANVGGRLASGDATSAVGFSNTFFSIRPATVAVILIAFTFAQLLGGMVVLMVRPRLEPR